jgi:hypothetical protein
LNAYTLYIYDDRYSVPTIDIVMEQTDARARAVAAERLLFSPHYKAVAVWHDDRFICELPEPNAGAQGLSTA